MLSLVDVVSVKVVPSVMSIDTHTKENNMTTDNETTGRSVANDLASQVWAVMEDARVGRANESGDWKRGARHIRVAVKRVLEEGDQRAAVDRARIEAVRALADKPRVVPVQTLDGGVENAPVIWPHDLRAALGDD